MFKCDEQEGQDSMEEDGLDCLVGGVSNVGWINWWENISMLFT